MPNIIFDEDNDLLRRSAAPRSWGTVLADKLIALGIAKTQVQAERIIIGLAIVVLIFSIAMTMRAASGPQKLTNVDIERITELQRGLPQ